MADARAMVTFLLCVVTFGSCQNDTNATSFQQDFWEMEVSYETWLRTGCTMGRSTPSARLVVTLTNENGTRLAMIQQIRNTVSQILVYDYSTINAELITKNKTAVGASSNGEFMFYSAFKLNGSHLIASDLNGVELAVRTYLQPNDIWNVQLNANGADLLSCLPGPYERADIFFFTAVGTVDCLRIYELADKKIIYSIL